MRSFWLRYVPALSFAGIVAICVAAAQPMPARVQPVKRPPGRIVNSTQVAETPLSDEEILKKAKLSETDGAKLIEYLRQRTLTETEQARIASIIKRFGADDFEERVVATEEIESYGSAAVGPLKAATKDNDAEVAYRARVALKKIETVPHSAVASAAVRAVAKLKPEGAAAALIGFLPLADDETVADVIREALVGLAVGKDGKADPALLAALFDSSSIRRAASYVALIQGGSSKETIRIKDAYPKVREAVLKEADVETKFVGLWSLATTTREKEYVSELVALIPTLPLGRICNSRTSAQDRRQSTAGPTLPQIPRVARENPRRVADLVERKGQLDRSREVRLQATRRGLHGHPGNGRQLRRTGADDLTRP